LEKALQKKNRRPLKMPKNYKFDVKNVDWAQYEKDFILRTDAVWERSKLLDIFYTHYKSHLIYDPMSNKYWVANLRMVPIPTNEAEHLEDWTPYFGYGLRQGLVWQFQKGPSVSTPTSVSNFVSDKEGDSWYLCFLSFQKYMMCNERSAVKVDEVNLYNKSFFDYQCYSEVEGMFDNCGSDLFEPLWETYRVRLMSGNLKPQGYARTRLFHDPYGVTSDRKVLHY
jgi:hypothetical protein